MSSPIFLTCCEHVKHPRQHIGKYQGHACICISHALKKSFGNLFDQHRIRRKSCTFPACIFHDTFTHCLNALFPSCSTSELSIGRPHCARHTLSLKCKYTVMLFQRKIFPTNECVPMQNAQVFIIFYKFPMDMITKSICRTNYLHKSKIC